MGRFRTQGRCVRAGLSSTKACGLISRQRLTPLIDRATWACGLLNNNAAAFRHSDMGFSKHCSLLSQSSPIRIVPGLICASGAVVCRDPSALSCSTINDCAHGNIARRVHIKSVAAVEPRRIASNLQIRFVAITKSNEGCYYSCSKQRESSSRFGGVGIGAEGKSQESDTPSSLETNDKQPT